MVDSINRIGRFTSSNAWKLTTRDRSGKNFGVPALSYIQEKKGERCLGRSLDLGKSNQSTVWGKVAEFYCDKFHLKGIEYVLMSKETIIHKDYNYWSGSPDFRKPNTAGEIKCYEPKNYFLYSNALLKLKENIISLEEFKKDFKEEYWQVVSNSILLNVDNAELVCFMPYLHELELIRSEIEEDNVLEELGIEIWQGRYIAELPIYNLPYVANENYPNFLSFEFEVPKGDKEFLTQCFVDAEKLINI